MQLAGRLYLLCMHFSFPVLFWFCIILLAISFPFFLPSSPGQEAGFRWSFASHSFTSGDCHISLVIQSLTADASVSSAAALLPTSSCSYFK